MNKKFFKSTLIVAMVAVTSYGSYKAYDWYGLSDNREMLLTANVEALSASVESGSGLTLFTICSRKVGNQFCTVKRGSRKWALSISFRLGASPSNGCPECPDNDYDYEDPLY